MDCWVHNSSSTNIIATHFIFDLILLKLKKKPTIKTVMCRILMFVVSLVKF